MSVILNAVQISKVYQSGIIFKHSRNVLEEVSLELEEGKTFGLMGSSGSGKTTVGKILAGLEKPSSGKVFFKGNDILSLDKNDFFWFRRKVQMVFQDPEGSLNPRKSIERSIYDILSLLKVPKRDWMKKTQETLEAVGLSDELLCRYPAQLSGGQNQRVALGRVLLLEPEIMILDEPTSALDISVQAQILRLLKELQKERGLAYLFISHQAEVVRFMAHRTGVLTRGRLVESLTSSSITSPVVSVMSIFGRSPLASLTALENPPKNSK